MSLADDSPKVMASDTASPSPHGAKEDITRLIDEFRGLAHDHLELALLETRLSVVTLIRMGIIAVFTALVLVSAWLALVGSAALGLISLGVPPVLAMVLIAVANVLAAFVGWLRIRHLTHWLGWAATRRSFKKAPPAEPGRAAA